MRALALGGGTLDYVGCFYSSLFFFDEPGNALALAEVARVLRPGGAFVLRTANPVHLRKLGPEERSFDLPAGLRVTESSRFVVGRVQFGRRRVTLATGEVLEGEFSIRHYAPGELEVLAHRVGLKLERTCGNLALGPYARHSRDLVVLLRKP